MMDTWYLYILSADLNRWKFLLFSLVGLTVRVGPDTDDPVLKSDLWASELLIDLRSELDGFSTLLRRTLSW